ncbi:hypothetical protein [Streptomyces sp. BV129]|uniref:hypothetical protein n=1 Tax=Streptomyces sp. BV129 TaxID=2849671 RepID=UPI001C2E5F9C|nr:hypothetical protein [Streptomyces sp. BV129]MBV1945936.1 hypothetical protein [Streptomyces sp. BV129]
MTEERLDVEWVRGWCAGMEAGPGGSGLVRATEESHRATDALVDLTPVPSDLTTLYWVLAEARLPDGRSVHPAATVAARFREHGEIEIPGEEPALVFASTPDGHAYALSSSGRVWRATSPSPTGQFDLEASSLREFLEFRR